MKYTFGKTLNLILIFLLLFGTDIVQAQTSEIAKFALTAESCGSKVIYATSGTGALSASADGINPEEIRWDSDTAHLQPRMQGKKLTTGWSVNGYWLIEFSPGDAENISFSADMYSSGNGPGVFELYCSGDNKVFTKIEASRVYLTQTKTTVYDNFKLPEYLSAYDKVYLKIMIVEDISVSGKSITGIKDGSTYINDIVITANASEETNKEPESEPEKKIYYPVRENKEMRLYKEKTGKYIFIFKNT